jgi:hypothetical protein
MSSNRKPLNFAQALRARPAQQPEREDKETSRPAPDSQPEVDSLSVPASQTAPDSLPEENRLPPDAIAYRPDSQPGTDSLPAPDSPKHDLWSPFREKKGHLRLPNSAVDGLYSMLDPYEQAVFTQLYRLSHGYSKPTCKIGLPQLARRSNMGKTTTQATVNRLIGKGLIRKLEYEIGKNKEQGTTYWVSSPDSQPAAGSLPGDDTIKIKSLKDNSKKGGAHERKDYSACPDCQGRGLWWPEGYERGVAKCKHEKLKDASRR